MALKKTLTLPSGVTAPDAYVRVSALRGSKTGLAVTASVYRDAAAFTEEDASPMHQYQTEFVPDFGEAAPGIWSQAYGALKQVPELEGAADC